MDTKIGLMPFGKAEEYNVRLTNRLIAIESPFYTSIGKHRVILNINHMTSMYGTSMTLYRSKLESLEALVTTIDPPFIVIENEELKEIHGNIQDYCEQLKIAVEVFDRFKVTNGGLTMPEIMYWYYELTKDELFFKMNIPTDKKEALVNGAYQSIIDKVSYELEVLKSIDVAHVNIHYYLGYVGAVDGWIRMIQKIKQVTGKSVVSDEAGVYAAGLLPEVVRVASETDMSHLVLYSGDGVNALPISLEQFNTLL